MLERETSVSSVAHARLFEPARIGSLLLPNRLIMAPMESNLANRDGTVSDTQMEYYRCRGAGGVGMVIVEYTCVDSPIGIGGSPQLRLDDDSLIESHAKLVDAIHAGGAKACVQLFHAGRQTHPKFIDGLQPVAASPIPCPMYRKMPREMTLEDIGRTVRKFREAAARAVAAGYDAVEIHGAHGYLLSNFLSRASNHRTDAFGGSLANRQRFPLMVVCAARAGAGKIPVIFRHTADEFVEDGIDIQESKDSAVQIVKAGADAIHVTTGCHERLDRNVDPVWMPEGWRIPLAKAIRDQVDVPVIAVGVIRHAGIAEQAVVDGSADFIALGRAILADPDWANKVRQGQEEEIRPCTSCNWCIAQIGKGDSPIGCAENPCAGHETDPLPVEVGAGLRAVVVGAGPGGICAALTLDQAGFQVTLLDRSAVIAPGLLASGAAPRKEKFLWYRDYLIHKLTGSGVDVKLGVEADAVAVAVLKPDVTILATGATDRVLEGVSGLDLPHVRSAYDVLNGDRDLGEGPVVIYGAGEIGCEAAKYAADRGYDVVLTTRSSDDKALARANKLRIYRDQFVANLKAIPNIRIELGCMLKAVRDDRVVFQRDGEELRWKAGTVLLAVGRLPDDSLAASLKEIGIEACLVGDAVSVERIGDAVHGAYKAVVKITRSFNPAGRPLESLAV